MKVVIAGEVGAVNPHCDLPYRYLLLGHMPGMHLTLLTVGVPVYRSFVLVRPAQVQSDALWRGARPGEPGGGG